MQLVLIITLVLVVAAWSFFRQRQFGRLPRGERLSNIRKSVNYRNGSFQNQHHTPQLSEGASYTAVLAEFLFKKKARTRPLEPLPTIKTDLHQLAARENVLIWFGHSSYFIQVDGKKILVDPVFSGAASPLPMGTRAFAGSDIYKAADIPQIDYLFISHDHWDHLDYKTMLQLRSKISNVICPLGVGEHLERWGFNPASIIEKDWYDQFPLAAGFEVTVTPARHFGGRTLKRNSSLWASYVLKTPSLKIFIGGDSGYDTHFAEIGKQHGPFDLAILENGQYDKSWRYIHLLPEEFLAAAKDLRARKILPVHSSKFSLGNHAWDEPLSLVSENNKAEKLQVITPMIGELVHIASETQQFTRWWEGVK
ncbi:MAG: MBL fold metallo-hydrolase [Chitinophagaceae bacterium]|nr:MAG: MBL fold metallo-hydrolase [Chitinophagaceae bacterium]